MGEGVWVLGVHMTRFGKHPDKDNVDLAAEASVAALADAGVTMKEIGVIGAGNLRGGGGLGQGLQKQIGQTGIPVYNVANACATGATALRVGVMAIKAGRSTMAWPSGWRRWPGPAFMCSAAAMTPAPGPHRGGPARSLPWKVPSVQTRCRASCADWNGTRVQTRRGGLRTVCADQ